MPNHVHLLVRPLPPWTLGQLIHRWKSFTAKAINKVIGGRGTFWLDERFAHRVRRPESLKQYVAYIAGNPGKAGLRALSIGLNRIPPLIPLPRAMSIFSLHRPRWALGRCDRASSSCLPVARTAGGLASLCPSLR